MPTIPQEINESTETLVADVDTLGQFIHGPAVTYVQVRGGTLRPLLYWQDFFQTKVEALAGPYVQQATDAADAAAQSAQAAADDAQATAADRVQTGLDVQTTASDRQQTGLDAQATAADRVQTGEDRTAAAASAQTATEEANRAQGYADQLNLPAASGNALGMLRQKADESGFEYRSPSQVRSDIGLDGLEWLSKPVGEPFPLWDHWGTISGPPTDDPRFRFIKLTAGETGAGQYNEGVLVDEVVTGSSPTITATAKVNLATSPLDGGTVHLVNTSRLFLRPGASSTMQSSQFESHSHGISNLRSANAENLGASGSQRYVGNTVISSTNTTGGDETRPRNVGVTYYMRIV